VRQKKKKTQKCSQLQSRLNEGTGCLNGASAKILTIVWSSWGDHNSSRDCLIEQWRSDDEGRTRNPHLMFSSVKTDEIIWIGLTVKENEEETSWKSIYDAYEPLSSKPTYSCNTYGSIWYRITVTNSNSNKSTQNIKNKEYEDIWEQRYKEEWIHK